MFKNKHVITALLVTPLLAILAWFAVGQLIGEKAAPAQPGQAYPLVEQSNCRYRSQVCDLENTDLRLTLVYDESVGAAIELTASHSLESILMSVSEPALDPGPRTMQPLDENGRRWRLPLGKRPGPEERIRIVASQAGSAYFAEASTSFLQPGDAGP